jgi:hypothetical protein
VGSVTSKQTVWSLHGNEAELICNNLSGRIDIARPHAGLRDTQLRGKQWPAVLLSVFRANDADEEFWPLSLAEAFVRGDDLVATYQPISGWPFSPQLYWRANELESLEGVSSSVSLLVSIQTHLLDTCPQIGVASRFSRGELFLLSTRDGDRPRVEPVPHSRTISPAGEICCVLLRLDGWPLSYVEIVQPGDFRESVLRRDNNGITVEWHLFADFLEKGVIRRARVHAALLTRDHDFELAAACCVATQQLELPLTA